MSGTMFIEVEPYYRMMQDTIAEARQHPENFIPADQHQTQGYNERLLKEMVRRGIGILDSTDERPYDTAEMHGVHLGVLRRLGRHNNAWRNDPLKRQIQRTLNEKRCRMVAAMCSVKVAKYLDRLRAVLDFDRAEWEQHPDYIPEAK